MGKAESLRQSVDARMAKERDTLIVWLWYSRVVVEVVAVDVREVVVFVEILEDGGCSFEVVVWQLDAPACGGVGELGASFGEVGRGCEKALMSGKRG